MRKAIPPVLVAASLMVAVSGEGASAKANPAPRLAAREAKACFVRFHWWTPRLADYGRTVTAVAPRKLSGYPQHWDEPVYQVGFYERRGLTSFGEMRWKLNRRENRIATFCRRAAWR
jgi:hypothetical protein